MRCPTLHELPPPPSDKNGWPWTVGTPPACDSAVGWPKISIVTPSFNQAVFLEETIRSVLLQGYPNLEYFVMDGGSRDGSVKVIRKYERWISSWMSGPDGGQTSALNRGFERSGGEILAWLNSDDVLLAGVLRRVARYWVEHAPCHFLSGDGEYVSADGKQVHYRVKAGAYSFRDLIRFYRDVYLPQPSVFFSRQAFLEAGAFDASLRYGMDLDLWLRLSLHYPLHYIPETFSYLRVHESSKSCSESAKFCRELRAVILRYLHHLPLHRRPAVALGIRRWNAIRICQEGLTLYARGDRALSRRALRRALLLDPSTAFSYQALRVAVRLYVPEFLKRKLLQ